LERKSVNDTRRFIWTAEDGRKIFAVISDTQVFFGNDEDSINRCLLAKRGETESLAQHEKFVSRRIRPEERLAFGFISTEGIKKIADLVGVSVAVGQTEDASGRGFISRILPQILNNATREISWVASKNKEGISDSLNISTQPEITEVLSETISASRRRTDDFVKFLPAETYSFTRYNLKSPQLSFRSLLMVLAKQTDAVNSRLILSLSNSLLGSYGIADAEKFLTAIDNEIFTVQLDEDGDKSLAIVQVIDLEKIKQSIVEELDLNKDPEKIGTEGKFWISEDQSFAAGLKGKFFFIGEPESVRKSMKTFSSPKFIDKSLLENFKLSNTVATTITKDLETAQNLRRILGGGEVNKKLKPGFILIKTNFNKRRIRRSYLSEFGFLGTIIEQFDN
jgi:hypothetical protein